jgi:hypothetical protein
MSDQTITLKESARLVQLERTIETGITTFVEVGQALMEIRDSRLYRIEHKTFEAYCQEKWGMSRTYAFVTIESSKAAKNVLNCEQRPLTESQARPLTKLSPEKQPEAWAKAVEIADGEQPTARQVEQAVRQTLSTDNPPKRQRGSYDDWREFREVCEHIATLCDALAELKVDAAHAIQARDLSARLAKKLNKISTEQ